MSALANNTEPETALAKAAAPDAITVGKVKPFNQDKSVIVQGVTGENKIAEVKVWDRVSDVRVGTTLKLKSMSEDPAPNEFQEKMVRAWNDKGYPVAGGGLWKCQSSEVDPSGPHFQTCFAGIKKNEPGIFCGKVEMIDADTVSLTSGESFDKAKFTITGTDGSECTFSIKSSAETKMISVGDMVAFFGADHGFAPRLDSVSYVPSITKVISDTTNTGSDLEEMTSNEDTKTPKEDTKTSPKEETKTGPKEETKTAPKEETTTTPKEDTTTTPKEDTTTPKEETTTPKETTSTKDQEKVPEEAAGVKRQMNDSPPLSNLKRSKSMAAQ
tara:strand:+ start:198 stop:1181 length:984 start_codon:yes stop_codon:yes gene_type:complete